METSRLRTLGAVNVFLGIVVVLATGAMLLLGLGFAAGMPLDVSVQLLLEISPLLALGLCMLISGVWLLRGTTARWKLARVLQGIAGVGFLAIALYIGVACISAATYANQAPVRDGVEGQLDQMKKENARGSAQFLFACFVAPAAICSILSFLTCFRITRALKEHGSNLGPAKEGPF